MNGQGVKLVFMPYYTLTLICMLILTSRSQRIEVKQLTDNPGILPLKLGETRIQQTYHTFIHNYPLQPIKKRMQSIDTFIEHIERKLPNEPYAEWKQDLVHLKLQSKKLKESILLIHPDIFESNSPRTKRGLINAIGSIFKFISGNLDASDGERYDKAINDLQVNQRNIIAHFNKQLSLNNALINHYQETLKNISDNFEQLKKALEEKAVINVYETINVARIAILELQDLVTNIQTAISFATLQILHMSIITEDQMIEMRKILQQHHTDQSFYSADNILFLQTIKVDYYITPEHIVFLLHVPILDKKIYQLYHLYSIPTNVNTTIIAPTSYVAMTDNSIYYLKKRCKYLQQQYYCSTDEIEKNFQQDTCIKNLLQVKGKPNCKQIPVKIDDVLVETINDQKYLLILPIETLIHVKCENEEVHNLKGVYLINVPYSCSFVTKDFTYQNLQGILKEEPVYLPPLPQEILDIKPVHLNLKAINLDQLSKLTLQTKDPLTYISTPGTTWLHSSIPMYCIIILGIIILTIYLKRDLLFKAKRNQGNDPEETVELKAFPTPSKRTC